jgi:peptidoglycan/xylan/chitin deacetylase (PgdA/CDA1 family)
VRRPLGRALALVALLLALAAPGAEAADPAADALASAYLSLGGRAALGPIIGPAFQRGDEPFLYLPTSRLVLQVPREGGVAVPINATEWLTEAGKDGWLDEARGVPRPLDDPSVYADLTGALAARRAWLTQPEIAAVYDADGAEAALLLYGLPTSRPERRGPFVAQRFQRAVLQLWVEPVAGAPEPGSVVPVQVGDLLHEAGLLPLPPRPTLPPSVAPGEVLTRVDSPDRVAITFDMGSIDSGLAAVLDALAERRLRATFFLTGDFVRHYEWALPRIVELGHEVANHTLTHPDLTGLGAAALLREVDGLDAMLTARGAPPPIWFRPPFGAHDRRVAATLAGRGYPLVMWRLDLGDWRGEVGVGDVISNGRRIRSGDVVVTHGGLPKTAAALPAVLDELAARGLKQVTLSELYGSP